ncbi:hypothetical protein B0J13DRAFT_677046 [Dactylonectria estremocensis]|uniref:Zn(2)-C6 fungal-type domain-containing protein n=1 Tax=Dactylonectria estremocensis TaxID=1079267 RepID=A0A9P9EMT2_9HYPO|nr:hypothetical protein B0J13DRAFT_677046 [Dactylonectria estremocensis]
MDPGPAYKRRRPAVACTECRRRKIRCDRTTPCGPCSKSPLGLQCVYNNSSSNSLDSVQHDHYDAFARLDFAQSVLKPMFHDTVDDLDLFPIDMTYLNDESDAGFIDYLGLGGVPYPRHEPVDLPGSHLDGGPLFWASRSRSRSTSAMANSQIASTPQLSWGSGSVTGSGVSGSGSSVAPSSVAASVRASSGSGSASSGPGSSGTGAVPDLLFGEETSTAEREKTWYHAFSRCKRLRFLFRGIAGHHNDDDNDAALPPGHETVRALMKTFSRLNQAAQRECESRVMSSHSLLGWHTTAASTAATGRGLLPPRATCDVLLETYINTFESVLRILHVPTFRREYESFWRSPASPSMDEDESFPCKLMMAMALGSCVCLSRHVLDDSERAQGGSPRDRSSSWIAHGKQWLARKMFSGSRADLDTAQMMCLLALARHTHHHTLSAGSGWFPGDHDLTRVGIQMGLHREPRTRSPKMSTQEAEIRRRLWATMLELSLQLCFDEGLPAPLSPESYDCEPPSSVTDEELEQCTITMHTDAHTPSKRLALTPSIVQVLLARTQRLRLRILHLVNAPGASKAYEESHQLAAELNTACCADLAILRSMKKPSNFQIKLLDVFTRPFVLALHGPFADKATTNPAYYYSRKMRMEASALLLANPPVTVPTPTEEHGALESPPGLTHAGSDACTALWTQGHGHFALVQRQATAALCLDLISELEEKAFPVTGGAGWRQLRDAVRSAVGMFERRVRAAGGTHSTQEFLFFACAGAYIEAMLRGCRSRDTDEVIANAARTALVVCCEVMERRRRTGRTGREDDGEEDVHMWVHSDGEDGRDSDGDVA